MAENVTEEEIAELIALLRGIEEQDSVLMPTDSGLNLYTERGEVGKAARRALSTAERLPALLAERDRWQKLAEMEVANAKSLGSALAKADAEFDAVSKACEQLSAERDRLAGEVERLGKDNDDIVKRQAFLADTLPMRVKVDWDAALKAEEISSEKLKVAQAEVERLNEDLDRANYAIRRIGMALGSPDEWADQATMIADVEGRVTAARETIAKLQFDIARISEYAASSIEFDITRDDLCKRITVIADAALAQLDAAPADEVPACHPYASPWGLDAAPEAETIDLPGVTSADVALRAHMRATFEKLSAAQEPLGAEFANLLNDHAVDLASDDLTADQIVIRNLEARVGEAERAVAEAVEIMLPFAEIAANEIRVDENDATKLPVRIGHVRAARAFVEKHGGAK